MTWDYLYEYATGTLGINRERFWRITLKELYQISLAFTIKRQRAWEQIRWLGSVLVNVNRAKKLNAITPQQLLPLDIDRPMIKKLMTAEEFKELSKKWS